MSLLSPSKSYTEGQRPRKQSLIVGLGSWDSYGTILVILAGLASLSLISGYQSKPVSFETRWQFSPIGLLTGHLHSDLLDFRNLALDPWKPSLDYFSVFLKTCILELPFYFFLTQGHPFLRSLSVLLISNTLTHPLVFFVFPRLFETYLFSELASEAFALCVEVLFMLKLNQHADLTNSRSLVVILIILANLVSWQVGILL